MLPALISTLRFLDKNAERYALLVFYTILVVSMGVLVLGRELLSVSPIWGLEMVQLMLVYLAWIGAAAAVKDRAHIRIDIIYKFLDNRGKAALYIIADLIVLGLSIAALIWSIHPVEVTLKFGSVIESLGVSKAWAFVSVPIGFGLVVVRVIQSLIENVICLIQGTPVFEGNQLFD